MLRGIVDAGAWLARTTILVYASLSVAISLIYVVYGFGRLITLLF